MKTWSSANAKVTEGKIIKAMCLNIAPDFCLTQNRIAARKLLYVTFAKITDR